MHRWHLQRFARGLFPVLLFVSLLCVVMVKERTIAGGRNFIEDEAYGHLAVARSLATAGVYGFCPEEKIPMTQGVLWRGLLACVTMLTRDPVAAAYFVGALCGLATLLMLLRLVRQLFPFPPFILYACVVLILSPGFLFETLSGTSMPLATCLVTAAGLFHIEGLAGRRNVLPMAAACFIGLASWVRVEVLPLWIVLSLHAWALSFAPQPDRRTAIGPSYVFVRSILGLLVLALFLLPLLGWNTVLIGVPWPRAIGAALSLDNWGADGPMVALQKSAEMTRALFPQMYRLLHATPFMGWRIERYLYWLGVIVLVGIAIWRREERPFTAAVFVPLVLPVFFAILVPYAGDGAVVWTYRTMTPLAVMVAAFGFFRLPFLVEGVYRKWKQGLPAPVGFNAWWICVGSIFLIVCLVQAGRLMKGQLREMKDLVRSREAITATITQSGVEDSLFATDRPGWLSYRYEKPVVDLTGEGTPGILMCLDSAGSLDPGKLQTFLRKKKPSVLLLWDENNQMVESISDARLLYGPSPRGGSRYPRLMKVTWSVGF